MEKVFIVWLPEKYLDQIQAKLAEALKVEPRALRPLMASPEYLEKNKGWALDFRPVPPPADEGPIFYHKDWPPFFMDDDGNLFKPQYDEELETAAGELGRVLQLWACDESLLDQGGAK